MKKLVIFDLDGTLLNTIDDLGAATNYALRECGYPEHNLAAYPMFVGNGVSRLIERALPEDERSGENVKRLREKFTEYYDHHCTDLTIPYPSISDMLHVLQEMGIRMAVASNKYQSAVTKLINHFFPEIEWSAVEGQKEGVPVKPDPSIVFEILAQSPARKAKVLYVGDSGVDMETARRACVDSAGVTWGFRPVKELKDYHADNIVNSPEEIITIVKRPGLELDV